MTILTTASVGKITTSETIIINGNGLQVFTVDDVTGFVPGTLVQIWSNTNNTCQMFGTVSLVSNNNISVMVSNSYGNIQDASWTINIIGFHSLSGTNPYGALTVDNLTQLSSFPTLGTVVTFNLEPAKALSNFSSVYVTTTVDYTSWFIATVLSYDPVGGTANLFVTQVSPQGTAIDAPWVVSLMSSTAIDADLTAYASDTLSPTAGSQITFTTVQSGKYFPIQGNVLIDDLTSTQNPSGTDNHYTGTIVAYTGNTLIVNVNSAFGSGGSSSSWGIYLIAGPSTSVNQYQMNGLLFVPSIGQAIGVLYSGSVRDSTNTVDLVWSNPNQTATDFSISSNYVAPTLSGTISSAAGVVTGTSTSFTTDFASSGNLTDLNNQLLNANQSVLSSLIMIASGTKASTIATVTNDTSATVNSTFTIGGGSSYTRGGNITTLEATLGAFYMGLILARKDADGTVAPFLVSFTKSGTPDLPSGYTYYRVIAAVQIGAGLHSFSGVVIQPLNSINFNAAVISGILPKVNGGTGFSSAFTTASNILGADVLLNNISNYFDGPSMAQGTSGTWFVSGGVIVTDTVQAIVNTKLWDGTTVISSSEAFVGAGEFQPVCMSGIITNPAGNIRISCRDQTNTTGKISFNKSGNSKDSFVWGIRIG